VRPGTSQILGENLEKTFQGGGITNEFLNSTLIAQEIIAGIDKLDGIKLKFSKQQRK
jgi:hypothetical protein